jgi:hypothetical protein
MARKSAAALTIVAASSPSVVAPPSELTESEADLWRAVVDSKPRDWFGEDSLPLLKEYVRAAAMCDRLDLRIKATEEGGSVGDVRLVLDMRDKEARRVAGLATKLRLTQQSRYTPQAASTANKRASGRRPWQG